MPCPLSASEPKAFGVGAFHEGISQILPVNDLTRNPVFSHFRQDLPVRSRARSPALIAPWLALGPSLWPGPAPGPDVPLASLAAAVRPSGFPSLEWVSDAESRSQWECLDVLTVLPSFLEDS